MDMATFEIENYIKLICIRVDHFESYIVDEVNTKDEKDIDKFLALHRNRPGVKILIFKMNTMEIITFDQVKQIIHTAHMFDYLRQLVSDGNKLLQLEHPEEVAIGTFIKYLTEIDE
jgi:hypothetical protein